MSALVIEPTRKRTSVGDFQAHRRARGEGPLWPRHFILVKRLFDVVVAVLALLLLSPVFLIVALAIRSGSAGPILYSQLRIGMHGERFRLYKFRSMVVGADRQGAYATLNDSRVTSIGKVLRKTRLDELPQLWNVLRGEMSLIGPRPELPENEEMLEQTVPGFATRTLVKPGITGWAQVCAPYAETSQESAEKLEYDLYYILHATIWKDLMIVFKTLGVMFTSRGR